MASFHYYYYDRNVPDLIYQYYDTHYPKQDPVLRFTKTDENGNALPWSTGRLLYSKTVPFGPAVDFTTTGKYIIKPNAPVTDSLAFFVVPKDHHFPNPPPGGILGLFELTGNSPNVFAVASDTPNYVSFGIDIDNRKPEAKEQTWSSTTTPPPEQPVPPSPTAPRPFWSVFSTNWPLFFPRVLSSALYQPPARTLLFTTLPPGTSPPLPRE